MNHRDLALAAMGGQPVEHIPFVARMELWFNFCRNLGTLPHPYGRATLWEMQRDMGVGIMGFGAWDGGFHKLVIRDVEVIRAKESGPDGASTVMRYVTPYGTLTSRDVLAA